ncbi:MAG: MFS transporter [Acidimicrobiales bacterium]
MCCCPCCWWRWPTDGADGACCCWPVRSILAAASGALAPNLVVLGASQTVSRAFSTTLVLLITIVAAEEMPAGSRAYSISVMTMTGALGAGMALWALPLADLSVRGWRILYLIPLLGLPVIAYVGRGLPESLRFARPHPDTPVVEGHGRRLWVLGITFFLISSFGAPATQLLNEFLRDERGFSAARVSLFTVLTSTPGGIGLVVGGRIADVRGRRIVVTLGVVGGAILTVLSFGSHGWPMWAWNLVGTVLAAGASPALGMYGPELFPTGSRGRANGIIAVVSVLGSAVGLVSAGLISDSGAGLGRAMQVLLVGPLIVGVLVLLSFPETAHRELEDLNPEDRLPA